MVQLLQIGLIGCGIGGVGLGERPLDLGRHRLGIHRVEPHMHVELAFAMLVVVLGGFRCGAMGVGIMPLMAGVLCAVLMAFLAMLIAVVMRLEGAALTEFQLFDTGRLAELDHFGVATEGFERLFKKDFETGADPEHQLCRLQRRGVRRLHIVGMR
ncbi:hypothetical protein ABIA13_001696 [Sinorhizobium fredii]